MKENCLEIYEHKGQRYFTQHQSIYTTNSHAKSDETKLRDIRKMLCRKKSEKLSCTTGEKSISQLPTTRQKNPEE